jgi:hypothetical protein
MPASPPDTDDEEEILAEADEQEQFIAEDEVEAA